MYKGFVHHACSARCRIVSREVPVARMIGASCMQALQCLINNQKLAAMITIADKTVTHGWSGRFLDDSGYNPSGYSGYNYEISGTGEGTITLSWDPSLEISQWFLRDNGLTKPQSMNTAGCC